MKFINPLSDFPTEMWLQAIADFEVILVTPGYEINMDYWHLTRENGVCAVCMAGASMVRRSQGLARQVNAEGYPEQDGRKLMSIDKMREGHFEYALYCLALPDKEEAKWLEVIQGANLEGLRRSLRNVHAEEDWRGLIEMLREAIARIDAEYVRLDK